MIYEAGVELRNPDARNQLYYYSGSSDDDDGAADSDYDSDDNSADAQMHRFFSKVESLGIPLCEDVLADPRAWAYVSLQMADDAEVSVV